MSEVLKALKSTLRLPQSKFPPRPPPKDVEKYLSRCNKFYAWQREQRPANSQDTFTLHDGPPYANGDLHVGHALNKITKDIICRTKVAEGRHVDYVPGWDCHGLPIELKAFEQHGWERGSGIDPLRIRHAARNFAANTVKKQMKVFKSWGIMADWENHWKTMDKEFELRQLKVFRAMAAHGLIVRRNKPVYWSPSSQTALAEAEIERDWHTSTAALVKFRIPAIVGGSTEPVHAVIWTTTPWTLPANQAIAIHKDMRYLLVRSKTHGNLIVAQTRVEYLSEQLGEEVELLKTMNNEELLNCTYSGLAQFGPDALERPIVHADFVTADDGTGLVHCAPGHGNEDYEALQSLIKSGRVLVKAPVDDHGKYTKEASPSDPSLLQGRFVFKEGSEKVLELLRSEKALISSYQFKHKYPVDWRTKQPIMIRATAQWFADLSKIKKDVIASLEKVSFRPDSGKLRLKSFVESRGEWCISRQRVWGVPIPALYHKETNEAVLTPEGIDHIIRVIEERGIDKWWSDPVDDPAWVMPGLKSGDYVRGKDTMDVWFDSGSSWSLMSGEPKVADVYLEGSDQHRGWFQSSILTAIAYQKASNSTTPALAPFKQLVTHGFTLDGQGKKMSKSIGNVVTPDEIINGFNPQGNQPDKRGRIVHFLGPDALRFWAASADWTSDVIISKEVIGNIHKTLDKYRVTMKVLLGMIADFDPKRLVNLNSNVQEQAIQHRMALLSLYTVVNGVRQHMQNYEFHRALALINEWIVRDVSALYLEAVKDSVYCDGVDSEERIATQSVLYHILYHFQQMLAPITPLLVEEVYEHTPESVKHQAGHPSQMTWDPLPEAWRDADLIAALPRIRAINVAVKAAQERARADKYLGSSLACDVDICFRRSDPDVMQNDASTRAATYETLLVVSSVQTMTIADGENGSSILAQLSKATTEDERQIVRAATVQHLNQKQGSVEDLLARPGQSSEGSSQEDIRTEYVSKTKVYQVQEVEFPDGPQKGEIMGFVAIRAPTATKCSRCWKYNVEVETDSVKGKAEVDLCHRCESVVDEMIELSDSMQQTHRDALRELRLHEAKS